MSGGAGRLTAGFDPGAAAAAPAPAPAPPPALDPTSATASPAALFMTQNTTIPNCEQGEYAIPSADEETNYLERNRLLQKRKWSGD
jgi:hypothetical protein